MKGGPAQGRRGSAPLYADLSVQAPPTASDEHPRKQEDDCMRRRLADLTRRGMRPSCPRCGGGSMQIRAYLGTRVKLRCTSCGRNKTFDLGSEEPLRNRPACPVCGREGMSVKERRGESTRYRCPACGKTTTVGSGGAFKMKAE